MYDDNDFQPTDDSRAVSNLAMHVALMHLSLQQGMPWIAMQTQLVGLVHMAKLALICDLPGERIVKITRPIPDRVAKNLIEIDAIVVPADLSDL